jgi:Secretion system C-terminal sorting domain
LPFFVIAKNINLTYLCIVIKIYYLTKTFSIMTSTHKNLLIIAFFQMLVFSAFSQVIVHDVGAIIGGWSFCGEITSTISLQGTSVTIPTPSENCQSGERNRYNITMKSSCFRSSRCDEFIITYDCTSKTWMAAFPHKEGCNVPQSNSATWALWRDNAWKIIVIDTPEGLMIRSTPTGRASDCLAEIIVFGETRKPPLHNDCATTFRLQSSPNPTTGLVNIRFEGIKEGAANIVIYNNIGSIVGEISTIETYKGQNETQIDLGNLPAGLYNIAIKQGEQIITQRIQKL